MVASDSAWHWKGLGRRILIQGEPPSALAFSCAFIQKGVLCETLQLCSWEVLSICSLSSAYTSWFKLAMGMIGIAHPWRYQPFYSPELLAFEDAFCDL